MSIWRNVRRLWLPGREWSGWPKVAFAAFTMLGVFSFSADWNLPGLFCLVLVALAACEVTK